MLTWHQPIYVGGHYLKWARGVPQSPWIADGEPVGDGSVQASLEAVIVRHLRADGSKLNSAGREDMDVRMLGGGRQGPRASLWSTAFSHLNLCPAVYLSLRHSVNPPLRCSS